MARPKPQKDHKLNSAQVLNKLNKRTTEATKTIVPALEIFAKFQELRASRLKQGLLQIAKRVGVNHPDFISMRRTVVRLSELNMQLKTQAKRIESRPVPKASEWLVYGSVLDHTAKPAEGLRVRVFDRDRKYDDPLGETKTDQNGNFAVIYHERDFAESGEKLPDLYIMVSDRNGKMLHSSRDKIRFEAGKSEYFLIKLDEQTKAKTKRTKPTSKQRRRKK